MLLRKTTVIPTDDKDLALRLLNHLIFEEPRILFVTLGKDAAAEQLAGRADKLTGDEEEPRWGAWVRDPDLVKEILDKLQVTKAQRAALKNAAGVSLSLTDRVCDIVPRVPEPDLFRIHQAFRAAEADRDA